MSRTEIRQSIGALLADILDEDHIELTDSTTADQVDGWDSITHVKLVLGIEKEFGIRFDTEEIAEPEDVGALVDLIERKLRDRG